MASPGLAIRSLAWSLLESAVGIGLSFVTVILIARSIGPAEFGLFSLALVTIQIMTAGLSQLFNEAIVQREDLEPSHINTAFWASVAVSLLLTLGCLLAAWLLIEVYDQGRLGRVLAWLSAGVLLEGFTGVLTAGMKREFQFRWIAVRTAIGRGTGSVVGIAMALAGWGIWALVAQYLVGALVSTVCTWVGARFQPRLAWSTRHLRELMQVALPSLTAAFLWILSMRVFTIMVGALMGPAALGHFSMAFRLIDTLQTLTLGVVNKVALPLLARRQTDRTRLMDGFATATERTALVLVPTFTGLALVAPELIPLMLGPGWEPAIPSLQVLAIGLLLASVVYFQPIVLTAIGRAKLNVIGPAASIAITLALLAIVHPYGVVAAAFAWVARHVLTVPLNIWLIRRELDFSVRSQLQGVIAPLASAVAMTAAVLAISPVLFDDAPALLRLAGIVATGVLVYGASMLALAPRIPRAVVRSLAGLRA